MSEWEEVTLGDMLTLQRGFDLPVQDRKGGIFPIIASTGKVGTHKEAKVKAPGVLIGRSGSIGGGQYITKDFWPLNTTLWVKDFKGNNIHFCYYLLKTIDFKQYNSGSGVPSLNRNHVHPLPVLKPSREEQNEIAGILGSIDQKIELNQRMNETLEGMARSIFKSWFVDFDPVHAKAEGRTPTGMNKPTAALFPVSFNDEGIPEGWINSMIGDEVTVCGGSTPSTKEPSFWGGNIHWTSPKDLSSLSHPVLLDTDRKITKAGLEKITSGLLPRGTVLMSSRAPIGYLAIAEVPVAINQGYIAMIANKKLSNVYVWLWTQEKMDVIESFANGSTFQEISKKNFKPIEVCVPSVEVMNAFNDIINPLYEKIVNNVFENQTLETLRDTLLPKLISGELRVTPTTSLLKEAV